MFWEGVAAHEERLQEILLGYLREREDKGVVIWGVREGKREMRVPVISFTARGRGSRSVVEGIERRSGFGCRWGHFYSKRLVEEVLGLGEEGVVRVSLVHYNTGEFFIYLLLAMVFTYSRSANVVVWVCRRRSERVCEGFG